MKKYLLPCSVLLAITLLGATVAIPRVSAMASSCSPVAVDEEPVPQPLPPPPPPPVPNPAPGSNPPPPSSDANPYCDNFTPVCAAFEPSCPPNWAPDWECLDACCEEYKDEVHTTHLLACIAFTDLEAQRDAKIAEADQRQTDCFGSGASVEVCIALRNADVQIAVDQFRRGIGQLARNVKNRDDQSYTDFVLCTLTCGCIENQN